MYEDQVTGLDTEFIRNIDIYPNPAQDILYIKSADKFELQAHIINNTGQVLIEMTLLPGPGVVNEINISGLTPGMYHLKLQRNDQNILYSKIIIE